MKSNHWRAIFCIILALFIMTYFLIQSYHRQGLFIGILLSSFVMGYGLITSDKNFLKPFKKFKPFIPVKGTDALKLQRMTQDISMGLNIPTPELYLFNSNTVNALGASQLFGPGVILISNDSIKKLSQEELATVIEFFCILLKNKQLSVFSNYIFGILFRATQAIDYPLRLLFGVKKRPYFFGSNPTTHLLAYICKPLVPFFYPTSAYKKADIVFSQDPVKKNIFMKTLWKITSYKENIPLIIKFYYAPYFIVNPLTKKGGNSYFQSQPDYKQRLSTVLNKEIF